MSFIPYVPIVATSIIILFSSISVLFMDNDKNYKSALYLTSGSLILTLAILTISLYLRLYNYSLFS
ncbi:MAG: NADH-quinone oxidoreductase subunit NuoN, partial [Metallosphaera sp.]